ncbi:MAG TPA: hypothetical protein VK797_22600 [Tepidisphaeraceae bacterium]|jgi:hypothetical protein|nr:hypothetical protein [Tepidisphaeraceae bacterium]
MSIKTAPTTSAGFAIQSRQCATCIYRKDLPWDIKRLEGQIADPKMAGFFKSYRVCHHARRLTCCAGFWARHKNDFTLGQLAQRLGLVRFVKDESRSA